jgi:hypothetical protein
MASALPQSRDIVALHDAARAAKDLSFEPGSALWNAIRDNDRFNALLWAEEDLARRRNVADAEIAANKRAIDGYNQKRNDAIERIDEVLLSHLEAVPKRPEAKQNSETAGAMIDRLSILSLKIRAMREQAQRSDVDQTHRDTCSAKLARLIEQRQDLAACLDRLLAEASRGESYFKVYRQFKMYNDPKLNPALYGEKRGA